MKRYSVFVSSTYEDLVEERKEVIQALLELDCIPIGMELFPATDDEQWKLIQELIKDCDYYILIVGGRYGSLNKDGISYTQMEYEYAMKIGVPIISFLPKFPDKIIAGKTDKDPSKAMKLEEFKKLAGEKMIKQWSSPEELGSVVSRSLVRLIKDKPRIGWVKADKISSNEANIEILELKQKIQELEDELKNKFEIANNAELSQGEDLFKVKYAYQINGRGEWLTAYINLTWNNLFSKTCTVLLDEAKEDDYKSQVTSYINHLVKEKRAQHDVVQIVSDYFKSILIQFKALGLIEKSERKRLLKDTSSYWKLTTKGDHLLTNLRAISKPKKE